jgi:hypothetical protein
MLGITRYVRGMQMFSPLRRVTFHFAFFAKMSWVTLSDPAVPPDFTG